MKLVPIGPINNIPALVQIMAWRRPGGKPLSDPMRISLLTHICVIRPQWVNTDQHLITPPWVSSHLNIGRWNLRMHDLQIYCSDLNTEYCDNNPINGRHSDKLYWDWADAAYIMDNGYLHSHETCLTRTSHLHSWWMEGHKSSSSMETRLWYYTFNGVHFLDMNMSVHCILYNHMCDK